MRSFNRREITSICPPDAPSTVGSGGGARGLRCGSAGFGGSLGYSTMKQRSL